jgi:tetratricopeptide (TPR) repeat protein
MRTVLVFVGLVLVGGCTEVKARRQIQQGNKSYYDGNYERAITEYEGALGAKPDLHIGWYNLGLAHLALFSPGAKGPDNEKHAAGAIKAFNEYLKVDKNDTKARDYLLSTYMDSGHYEGAVDFFMKKLEENPSDPNIMAQLAQIYASAGKFAEANEWHRKRVGVETSTDAKADVWYSIGVLSWRRLNNHGDVVGEERAKIADEGIAALEQADTIRKDHQATLTYLNLLYRERSVASEASWARAVDQATATVYYKQAIEIAKRAQHAPATPPPTNAKPGEKPAPKK